MAKRLKQHIEINGQNRWVTGYTHQEVLDNAIKLVIASTKAEAQTATEKKVTFAAYAKNWLVLYKEHTLKHTTLREYTTLLNKHILPAFGKMDICAITIDDVQRFMNDKASMSRKSIHEMVMVLGMILESAVEDGIITRNPARSKRLKNPSKKKMVRNALEREQVVDIIANLHRLTDERDVLLLALLIGMIGLASAKYTQTISINGKITFSARLADSIAAAAVHFSPTQDNSLQATTVP